MQVIFTNLYKANNNRKKILNKIKQLIKNNEFVGSKEVKSFESDFAKFLNMKYCITVGNGTDAIEIAIESLNLKRGSEIIVPVNTWIATAEPVSRSGHKLVLCDIDLDDYTLNIQDLKKKISKNTKAIIPVHLYGHPAKMNEIIKLAKKNNIKIIEDCAQAHGTKYNKRHVGTFGDIGAFSFFPSKNLGAYGDGGAIVTNNKLLAKKCFQIRNHGSLNKYDHELVGRNSRMDSIQAGILRIKMRNFLDKIKKKKVLAKIYYKELLDVKEINLPFQKKGTFHSYHQFVVRLENRDKLRRHLKKNKIGTMIHYPYMLNELKFFKKNKRLLSLKNSKNLGGKLLSLPITEEHSINEIKYVSRKIKDFFKS